MMITSLPLRIAIRFSWGRKCSDIVSLISIISAIGISLGVAVLIISLSAMNGFERELNNRILAIIPHGEIEPIHRPFINWQTILKRIEQVPGIIAAAPYLNFTGLVECNGNLQAVQIKGIDPVLEMRLSVLPHYINPNDWLHFQNNHQQIIIGRGLANALKVKSGSWLTLLIPNNGSLSTQLLQPKRIRLKISGIFSLNSKLDHNFAMIKLVDAQSYLQQDADIGGIAIKVNDVFNANKLVRAAGEVVNTTVRISSWINMYGYIYKDIQMIRTIIYLAMTFIIGIACFNIVSILVTAVKDKSADIAILRTFGSPQVLIHAIFIWYGLLTSLIGSVIGIIVGILISLNLTKIIKALEYLLNYKFLSDDIYFINFLPTELHLIDVISVLITTIIFSLITSWYPAKRASNIDPVKILSKI